MFQSLSGLSLGLNRRGLKGGAQCSPVSIPFRAVTGFELLAFLKLQIRENTVSIPFRAVTGFELSGFRNTPVYTLSFNPFQGCHWV